MALSGEEPDLELRDAVLQVLDESGALNKIKAELRSRVFQALYDSKQLRDRVPPSKACQFVAGSKANESRLTLAIVKDLLEQLDLRFTLSVFEAELHGAQTLPSRKEAASMLDIKSATADEEEPLLSVLVHSVLDQDEKRDSSPPRRTSGAGLQLSRSDVKSMFAEQSFFAQLDKADVDKADDIPSATAAATGPITEPASGSAKPPKSATATQESSRGQGPEHKEVLSPTGVGGQNDTTTATVISDSKGDARNRDQLTLSPPVSPDKSMDSIELYGEKLSPLKPLSSLKDLPQLHAPSKLPSLKRLPPAAAAAAATPTTDPLKKPAEGDASDEDVESLGEDLLASLGGGSDSATATQDVSTSLAEIAGGDYVEHVATATPSIPSPATAAVH